MSAVAHRRAPARQRGQAVRAIRQQAGFTLIEMMVALAAGSILISSLWMLSTSATNHFHRQSRISQAQGSLRAAAEQIRRDVGRAGFLAPNNTFGQVACGQGTSSNLIQALTFTEGAVPSNPNPVRNDSLILAGNFATDDQFQVEGVDTGGLVVTISNTSNSFNRSFGNPYEPATFATAFLAGRQVRVEFFGGQRPTFYREISSVNAGDRTVSLTAALPNSAACIGSATDAVISPISRIQYSRWNSVNTDADGRFSRLNKSTSGEGADKLGSQALTPLVRNEILADNTNVDGSVLAVLPHLVEFRYQPISCAVPPCTLAALTVVDPSAAVAAPQNIQGLRFFLSTRSREQERNLNYFTRATTLVAPLTTFQVAGANQGVARVRSVTFDVSLPNNMRP